MTDPRLARLSELIVGYSLGLQPGKILRIDTPSAGIPLAVELYRAALLAGASPYTSVELELLAELLVKEGTGEQLDFVPPLAEEEIDRLDAIVTIWADANTRALSGAAPERHQRLIAATRDLTHRRWARISAGELRWCGVLFPTPAHAQDAEMSNAEYEEFVYRACHVEEEGDAVGHWQATSEQLKRRAEQMSNASELRIVGPDTDLRVVVEGRRWEAADGRYNMPDGEVYTSPVETETEGEIRFTFPALFQGREVDDIRFRFENGSIVAAEAKRGGEFLEAVLNLDEGARRVGEVSFGLNYEIDRFTNNTLFDEKIGGTMHLALGSAFKELGGRNESALHWDLVCDLRKDGEVYADGELVWRAGQFLEEPALAGEPVSADLI
ncbi:MAG: aminopeptidase [Gaiellaceae bacterium]